MAYALHKELLSPTGVEQAVWGRVFGSRAAPPQLIVSRGTVLDIHELRSFGGSQPSMYSQLHTLASFQFEADILDLQVLTLSGRGAALAASVQELDVLAITFANGRLSVVALDPFAFKLRTLAMLNFDENGIGAGCSVQGKQLYRESLGVAATGALRVDPEHRVLCFMPYDNQLAVIPVRKALEGIDETDDKDFADEAAAAVAGDEAAAAALEQDKLTRRLLHKPFMLNLKDIGMGIAGPGIVGHVADMSFLHGYSVQPALAVLVQTALTTSARLASLQNTTTVAAVSLDATGSATPVVWQKDGLPHDCYSLVALPSPVGGVVVVSPNALFYCDTYKTVGLATNGHAAYTVDLRGKYKLDTNITHDSNVPRICVSLNAVRAAVITPDRVLLTDISGALYLLCLHTVGRGEVHHLTLLPTSVRGPPATCLLWKSGSPAAVSAVAGGMKTSPSSIAAGLLFTGSRETDSVLSVAVVRAGGLQAVAGKSAAAVHLVHSAAVTEALDDDDTALYQAATGGLASATLPSSRKRRRESDGQAPPGLGDDEEAPPGAGDDGDDDAREPPGFHAGSSDSSAAHPHAMEEDEDAFLYGAQSGGAEQGSAAKDGSAVGDGAAAAVAPLTVHPVDCFPCLGPVLDGTMARSARMPSDEDEEPPLAPPSTELVLCSSRREAGSINVLHRALRPHIASQLRIAGCVGLFAVPFSRGTERTAADESTPAQTGMVLMSTDSGTRVLQVGEGLSELPPEQTELVTGARTLAAATFLNPSCPIDEGEIGTLAGTADTSVLAATQACHLHDGSQAVLLQVHMGGVRVTAASPGTAVVQELSLSAPIDVGGLGAPDGVIVTSAATADPYMLLRLSDGTVRLLTAQESDGECLVEHVQLPGPHGTADPVTTVAMYRDTGGAFAATLAARPVTAETAFAFLARRSGEVNVLSLPSLACVCTLQAAHMGPQVLLNSLPSQAWKEPGRAGPAPVAKVDGLAEPCDDSMVGDGLASAGGAPPKPRAYIKELAGLLVQGNFMLVVLTSRDDVFAYQLMPALSVSDRDVSHLPASTSGRSVGSVSVLSPSGAPLLPKRGEKEAAASAARFDADMERFMDVGHPVQVHRAAMPRFVRLAHAPGHIVTRLAGTDVTPEQMSMVLNEAELALLQPQKTMLRVFSDISGWQGVAVLTPSPIFLLAIRGTLVPVPMGLTDVTGAAGSTTLPGEYLAWAALGPASGALVTAFTVFNAPFCPSGFICAHRGHVQFATLPPPQWSRHGSEARGQPRPVPAWLMTGELGGAPSLAVGDTALRLHGSASTAAGSSSALSPGEGGSWPAVPLELIYEVPTAPPALIVPGPCTLPFYRQVQGGRTVQRLAYLEHASASMGSQALMEWYRRQKRQAQEQGLPLPVPPTAAQLACCVQPLFAAGMSVRVPREHESSLERHAAMIVANNGMYEQVSYGEHIEFGPVPLPEVHRPHQRKLLEEAPPPVAPDAVAEAFNDAGLGRPPVWDTAHAIVLQWGSSEGGTGWAVADSYELEQDEHIMCMKEVPLAETVGMKPESMLIVGTSYLTVQGEDYRPKGRLMVFRVQPVLVPSSEEGQPPVSMPRLKLAYAEDVKAVPSVVAGVVGRTLQGIEVRHVVVGCGNRVQVYEWHTLTGTPKLRLCSFVDFRVWVTSIEVVRDFVSVTDAHGGLFFYQWREEDKQLLALGQAPDVAGITAASAIVNGEKMGLLSLDRSGNLAMHAYAPSESWTRLRLIGDYRVGVTGRTGRMIRTRLAFPLSTPATERRKQGVLVPSYSGGLSILLPLDELTFKRLAMLQRVLTYCTPHAGGLHPRFERLADRPRAAGISINAPRNILDGGLLHSMLQLSAPTAAALAASVGTTVEKAVANLRDADLAATTF